MPEQLDIDVSFLCRDWLAGIPDVEDRCRLAATAAYDGAGAAHGGGAEVSIVLADDRQVRRLNRDYRAVDRATNVLSFANVDGDGVQIPHPDGTGPVSLGDVVIAFGVTVGEAGDEGKAVVDHLAHLVVHGVLHLLGHDHIEEAGAERMEALERAVLEGLGVADPYRDTPDAAGPRQNGMSPP